MKSFYVKELFKMKIKNSLVKPVSTNKTSMTLSLVNMLKPVSVNIQYSKFSEQNQLVITDVKLNVTDSHEI